MNAFRVLFLTLVFALSMLFLIQNTQVLDERVSLVLDLWWVELASPGIALYVFVFLCLLAGIIFGVITFFPGNRELRSRLRLLRLRMGLLTREVVDMQKKEELQEQKQDEEEQHKDSTPVDDIPQQQVPPPAVEDAVARSGGTAGKIALVAIFAVFVILTGLYFFMDQKMTQLQAQIDATVENSSLAVEIAREVDEKTAGFSEDIAKLSDTLAAHDREIASLRSLPQDTMNYLTMMLINEYAVKIRQLTEEAETQEDRDVLNKALDSLEHALEYYTDKVE